MSCPHGNPIGGCDTCDEVDAAFEAGKRSALAEQPAQQEPVLRRIMQRLADLLDEDHFAEIESIVTGAGVTPPAQREADSQQEPVRIYDYVWPQRDEHKEDCVYACSYTPANHVARGELLAVVHPSQLQNAYLQREGETEKITLPGPVSAHKPQSASPTSGMSIAQRILHVGGRDNAAGYVEFGSIQAVEALVRQVLRDLPAQPSKPWVGLTPEEIAQGNKDSWVTEQAWQSAVWWAEDKLKEKNA